MAKTAVSSRRFADLLAAKVDTIEGVERVRFMTSHPRDMTEAVLLLRANTYPGRIHLPVSPAARLF